MLLLWPDTITWTPVWQWGPDWPWHSTGSEKCQEEHQPGGTDARSLLYLASGELLVHNTNYAKKTYFRTKAMGKRTICESFRCCVDGDSRAVYPQELSPLWRCWVNSPWPPADPRTACVSAARRSQPGSTAPKHCPEKQRPRWPRSQLPILAQHGRRLPSPFWGFIHLHLPFLAAISSGFSNVGHWWLLFILWFLTSHTAKGCSFLSIPH